MDVNSQKYNFKVPSKEVKNPMDIQKWQNSETYHELINFIQAVCKCITGKSNSSQCFVSPNIEKLLKLIDHLQKLVESTPPINQPQRFGNAAFRSWHQKMSESFEENVDFIPCEAVIELKPYFIESFGNSTRIDYGTGHELSFILFLMGLFKIGVLLKSDELAVALRVFNKYLHFVRLLQTTYKMEPAGSHGVWSLDDYQFIPFIWGSAQLTMTPIEPVKFVEDETIEEYKDEYMFIGCIDYINKVKTGHIAEHSNQLWSISAVTSWSKICQGLIKMYQKEVLSKFPVVQHILFGSIFTLNPPPSKHSLNPMKP